MEQILEEVKKNQYWPGEWLRIERIMKKHWSTGLSIGMDEMGNEAVMKWWQAILWKIFLKNIFHYFLGWILSFLMNGQWPGRTGDGIGFEFEFECYIPKRKINYIRKYYSGLFWLVHQWSFVYLRLIIGNIITSIAITTIIIIAIIIIGEWHRFEISQNYSPILLLIEVVAAMIIIIILNEYKYHIALDGYSWEIHWLVDPVERILFLAVLSKWKYSK